ncbi:Hsp70 family protein [Nostoc sp.]|uniref:Hsp70 family protein n=1 Tax=Nostoc sp. TaxID=1180 RepID=UPI002FF80D94
MAKVIGIDLGTTMSAMAYIDDMGRPAIIPNAEGHNLTPSVIMIRGDERVVGRTAKNAAVARPKNVIQFIKRKMSEPDYVFTDENGQEHRPEELSALILKKLKQDAEKRLGEEVKQAVITVPAYFADLERQRTKQAGEIAGFEVLDIINEPTAAAIAYGIEKAQDGINIFVYDLGGGTFDATLMQVGTGELRVLATDGNKLLGGYDFDEEICQFFAEQFRQKHDLDPLENLQIYQKFLTEAETAKVNLSADVETYVNLTAEGKVHDFTLKREQFENLIEHHINQTLFLSKRVLSDAHLDWEQVNKVLLVGGSTRIPLVQNKVKDLTKKEPETGFNPDEVVALGAAIYAAGLAGETVRKPGGKAIAPVKVRNVTAHSLGIITKNAETDKDINSKLIFKNTEIPAKGEGNFTTIKDNQTEVEIQIIQGEDENPENCDKVGDAGLLTGIPPQPKGVPQIEVSLSYDESGFVYLYARELESGKKITAKIKNHALLSREEVKRASEKVAALQVT